MLIYKFNPIEGLPPFVLPMKVKLTFGTMINYSFTKLTEARHLYLIDLDNKDFPNLEATIKRKYPDVKVRTPTVSFRILRPSTYDIGINHPSRCLRRVCCQRHLRTGPAGRRKTRRFLCQCTYSRRIRGRQSVTERCRPALSA